MKKLLMILFVSIFLISLVSASDFGIDNYVKVSDNQKIVEIWDNGLFLIGQDTKLVTAKLDTELDEQVGIGYVKVFEMNLETNEDYNNLIEGFDFYNVKDGMKPIEVKIDLKYKTTKIVTIKNRVCSIDNKTKETTCNDVPYEYNQTEWIDYTPKTMIKGDKITISGWTETKQGDKIEWIPTIAREKINTWATWSADLNTNIIGYWNFENTSFTDAIRGNNGTASGALVTNASSGKVGNGVFLDGVSYIDVEGNTSLDVVSNFAINFWLKAPAAAGDGGVLHKRANPTYGYDFGFGAGGIYFEVDTGAMASIGLQYEVNTWIMITGIYNGSTYLLYRNGVLNNSVVGTVPLSTAGRDMWFGKNHDNAALSIFSMDELGIWNRSLTQAEVTQLYNGGTGMTYTTIFPSVPNVTLNSPINYYNSTSPSVTLNCTATNEGVTGEGVTNITLWIDGNNNYSIANETAGINLSLQTTLNFAEGSHNWTCNATNYVGTTQPSVRYFNVDSVPPTINITQPYISIDYWKKGDNITINYTASDTNLKSCWYSLNNGTTNTSISACANNNFTINITSTTNNSVTLYANDNVGNTANTTRSWIYKIFENSRTFNSSSYETAFESYSINVSANNSLTGINLLYNSTSYPMTNQGSGTWIYSRDLPTTIMGNNTINFSFTYGAETINSYNSYQNINPINLTYCPANSSRYINFTFKDEGNLSRLNGAIPTSTMIYWLGTGTVTKTLNYINNTANTEYPFCFSPVDRNVTIDIIIQYVSTDYPQRIWNPLSLSYSNYTTNKTLYLLSSTDGIYVTFQVVNSADQTLSGVEVIAKREISGVNETVGQGTTSADGSVTFWLNPDFLTYFTFSKTGFTTYETSFFPTQTGYTITLGGGGVSPSSYYKGININIIPLNTSLENDTAYDFGINITSSFWDLDEFGFNLRFLNGSLVTGTTTTTSGDLISVNYNVGNSSKIFMDYYWLINGTYTNSTKTWIIFSTANTQWSIKNFFTDLKNYMDSGLFGIDEFGKYFIAFIIIFFSVGIVSYKYGLTSPMAVSTLLFLIVLFLETVVNIIPPLINLGGHEVTGLLTFLTGLILAMVIFREVTQ